MNKVVLLSALVTTTLLSGAAWANKELASSKACLACHSIEKKVVGPAFKDVAARYKDDKDAQAKLTKKIMEGGAGVWGQIPMPAQHLTNDEATTLVKWVLAQ